MSVSEHSTRTARPTADFPGAGPDAARPGTGRADLVHRRAWGIGLLSLPVVAWAAHDFIVADRFSVCTFRNVTGELCPFCGLTRAFAHATHLEFAQAWDAHPLWWLAFAVVLVAGIGLCLDGGRGADIIRTHRSVIRQVRLPAVIAIGLWWVVRLILRHGAT